MRTRQNTLLASVAALALFAATGVAFAQQGTQTQNGTPAVNQNGTPAVKKQSEMQAKPATPAPAAGQHARTEGKMDQGMKKMGQGPQGSSTTNMSAKGKAGAAEQKPSAQNSAQENNGTKSVRINKSARETSQNKSGSLKGLQGNAALPMQGAGGKISLTPEQRTSIRDSVIGAQGAPRVGHVDFDLHVGTLIPRRHIHVVPVPETLVRIDPQWEGFLYFIVRDDVVIVNPRNMRIVAVLPV